MIPESEFPYEPYSEEQNKFEECSSPNACLATPFLLGSEEMEPETYDES